MVATCAMAGLRIDVASSYSVHRRQQATADSPALATAARPRRASSS